MAPFRVVFAALTSLAGACVFIAPIAAQDALEIEADAEIAPATKGEQRLAKLLEGRVAGDPQRCIRTRPSERMQTIDGTAYIYGSGNTIYVQRTTAPNQINDSDALVIRRFNASELCRLDATTTIDPFTGIFTGVVFFEDFVPYTRIKADASAEG